MSTLQLTGGWIEVIAGVMFSGKSEELMRRVRRAIIARKRVQVFKSHLDDRYAGIFVVSSHDGRTVEAVPVDSSAQIASRLDPTAQVIAIDEAQFLDAGDRRRRDRARDARPRVILAGTDTDFRGEPFGPMPRAAGRRRGRRQAARDLCDLRAPASRNQRLIEGEPAACDSPVIMVGGTEAYEARCRACHQVRRREDAQGLLGLQGLVVANQ